MNDNLTTNTSNEAEKPAFLVGAVSGSITVYNGGRLSQKHIIISKDWANTEYYTIKDNGECLVFKKCYMDVPKNAYKLRAGCQLSIEHSEIQNGKYVFDNEETNEDEAVVYYR